ncbi:apyrase-like [Raphidocelis subcapitata]|uniref:Apyrase-like n=1 Tax=Raphidocelis subcapitata TaxID=307507 RepID=A0A2V0NYX4_9CHLO|nr:apyrase-like [Raphidocelis subcapitata]|eukprot:GBF92834.1 apyrase-like [Raphidocelis subcapitata]
MGEAGNGGTMLPASTRAVEYRAVPATDRATPQPHPRIGKLPFTHPRVFRRHDRLVDKLHRFRGVIAAVTLPIAVLLLIWAIAPGGGGQPRLHAAAPAAPGDAAAAAVAAGPGAVEEVYSIVLDAGSTGSRIHVYKFERRRDQGGQLLLISDTFEQLKPGLSAFPDDPKKAAASLEPLLATAVRTVPKALRRQTSISLKATAGLRLLPGSKAEDILKAVGTFLKTFPFKLGTDAVGIMDGAHEGAYAWLTLNYLLGKLSSGPDATVAAIDLGGGSVQEAFALPDAEAAAAPGGYVTTLRANGKKFSVYVHSYLGYGLMAARAKVIESNGGKGHPCFAKGSALKYSYADKEYSVGEVEFAKRATSVCGKPESEVARQYSLAEGNAPYFCLDLSFCHTVLTQGFDLPEDTELTLVKQVKYNGQAIEAAWPLGAAIDGLSQE